MITNERNSDKEKAMRLAHKSLVVLLLLGFTLQIASPLVPQARAANPLATLVDKHEPNAGVSVREALNAQTSVEALIAGKEELQNITLAIPLKYDERLWLPFLEADIKNINRRPIPTQYLRDKTTEYREFGVKRFKHLKRAPNHIGRRLKLVVMPDFTHTGDSPVITGPVVINNPDPIAEGEPLEPVIELPIEAKVNHEFLADRQPDEPMWPMNPDDYFGDIDGRPIFTEHFSDKKFDNEPLIKNSKCLEVFGKLPASQKLDVGRTTGNSSYLRFSYYDINGNCLGWQIAYTTGLLSPMPQTTITWVSVKNKTKVSFKGELEQVITKMKLNNPTDESNNPENINKEKVTLKNSEVYFRLSQPVDEFLELATKNKQKKLRKS